LFRLVHRVLGASRIHYITDAMAAAGSPPGRHSLGSSEMEVGADGIVRRPGQSNFAGSALRPLDGVMRAARMLGLPWQEVWDGFSVRPSRWMGWPTGLDVGAPADFCLLQATGADGVRALSAFVAGEQVA
jgi:N-acetylglucosamine-6-phosphate deacetylase